MQHNEIIKTPYTIELPSIGSSEIGYISVVEQMKETPFKISRVYWTYFTPESVKRGGHANIDKELLIIAVSGIIKIETELQNRECESFVLDRPNKGLYLPAMCWHTMQYSHSAVQVVLASNFYSESDYIRDYKDFIKGK